MLSCAKRLSACFFLDVKRLELRNSYINLAAMVTTPLAHGKYLYELVVLIDIVVDLSKLIEIIPRALVNGS